MAYFIRRYQKGVAQSGTQDVFVSESEIPVSMFCEMAEMIGPGKYILGQRGEGIRGFKKITDTIVPEESILVFAAEDEAESEDTNAAEEDTPADITPELVEKKEKATSPPPITPRERDTISMRRTEKLSDMSDEQLSELVGGMAQTDLSAETITTFQSDLARVHEEMITRGMIATPNAAEDKIVIGAGFSPWKAAALGGVVGLSIGVLGSMHYYKSKMDDINVRLAEMDASIREAESTITSQERRIMKAEENEKKAATPSAPVQRDPFDLDLAFLSSYNANNGRIYD
jgi:Sec-independent protein translocase protein TatA